MSNTLTSTQSTGPQLPINGPRAQELTEAQKERWARSLEEARKKKAAADEKYRQLEQEQRMCRNAGPQASTEASGNNRPAMALIAQHQYTKQCVNTSPRQPGQQQQKSNFPNNHNQKSGQTTHQPMRQTSQNSNSTVKATSTLPINGPNGNGRLGLPHEVFFKLALLDTGERFKVSYCPFNQFITEKLKEVPSRNYDFSDKSWNYALKDYEKVKSKIYDLRQHKINVALDEVPMGVRQNLLLDKISPPTTQDIQPSLSSTNNKIATELLNKIDSRIRDILFPFQRRGVSFGIQRNGRLLIADEMGLGKTVQAIGIASAYRNEWPLLIICPSSVKYMWATQIFQFLPDTRPCVIETGRDYLPNSRTTNLVIIMSYDLMSNRIDELKRQTFYVLIFDECHMLKEPTTKRTKSADELARRAHRVLLLSGTPALSRPAELFTQIKMIDPKIFPFYKPYAIRYCEGRQGKYGFEAKGQSNSEELRAVMSKIMIRRLKKDVLEDLPTKRREIVYLSGDAIDNKMKELKKAREDLMRTDRFSTDNRAKAHSFIDYYGLTGQAKMGAVSHHIVDTYFYDGAPEKKVLIFAHHLAVLDHIAIQLAKSGVQYIRIDGSTNPRDRQTYCDQFQTDTKTKAAVLSITAAGTGITLTAASIVIFAELYWNPSSLVQAEDRAHRVGQRDSVHVQYMLAKGTIDVDLWDMVKSKLQVLGNVNLAGENYVDAKKSTRYCPDYTEQHLMTDFFSILNGMEGESEHQHKENKQQIEANKGELDMGKANNNRNEIQLEPELKRIKKSNSLEIEEMMDETGNDDDDSQFEMDH